MKLETKIYNEFKRIDNDISDYNYEETESELDELIAEISDAETQDFLYVLLQEELDSSVHWIIPANILYAIKTNNIKVI